MNVQNVFSSMTEPPDVLNKWSLAYESNVESMYRFAIFVLVGYFRLPNRNKLASDVSLSKALLNFIFNPELTSFGCHFVTSVIFGDRFILVTLGLRI